MGPKSGRSAGELDWRVDRYHCPGGEQGWRPAFPPVVHPGVEASLPSISLPLAGALPLPLSLLSLLWPLTGLAL